jgi:hypothetical protein
VYKEEETRFNQEGEAYIININRRLGNNKTLKGCVAKDISNVKTQLVKGLQELCKSYSRGIYICNNHDKQKMMYMSRMESTRESKRTHTTFTTVTARRDNCRGGLLEKMI